MDLLFVLKFGWGIKGVGWATIAAQAVSTVMCLIYMFLKFPILRLKKEDFEIDIKFYLEHLRIGIPMGIQMSVLCLGIVAVQYVLNGLGSIAVAAFTTAVRVDQLFSQTFIALAAAVATFTAQNFGANKPLRIKQGARSAIFVVIITSVLSFLILYFYGKPIVSIFLNEPNEEVLNLAQTYLTVVTASFFFFGSLVMYRNVLQGMGSVIIPLISGVVELVARILAAFVLVIPLGYFGICLSAPLAWIFASIFLYTGYKISLLKMKKKSLL